MPAAEHGFEVEPVKQLSQPAIDATIRDIEVLVSVDSAKKVLIEATRHVVKGRAADVPGVVPRPALTVMSRLRDIHVDVANGRPANAFSGDVDPPNLPVISARPADGAGRPADILEQITTAPHDIGEGLDPLRPGSSGIL